MLLRTRITLGVMAGVVLVATGLVAGRLSSDSQNESRYQALAINDQGVLWQKIVDGQIQAIEAGISGLTRNRKAMQALAEGNKTALSDAVIGVFNRMSTRKVISRLHLTDRAGTIIYSSTGDVSQTSPLAEQALSRGEVVAGLYKDLDGSIQVTVATPLFHRGKPAGVGLLMRDVDAALSDLQVSIGAHIAFIKRDGLRAATTDPAFFDKTLSPDQVVTDRQSRLHAEGLTYTTTPTLTVDYNGGDLGILLSARDETDLIAQRRMGDVLSYGLTALLLVLVVGALFFYIRRSFKALTDIADALGEHGGRSREVATTWP